MVDIKELKKQWRNEYITGDELKEINEPKKRLAKIIGAGTVEERTTKTDKTYHELVLPVEMGGESRKLRLGQFQQKFLDYLFVNLGQKSEEWVGALLQLNADTTGKIPNVDGLIVRLPEQKVE